MNYSQRPEGGKGVRHILMLGPSLRIQGGVSTVEQLLLDNWPVNKYQVQHIATLVDGSKWRKLAIAVRAFAKFLYALLIHRPDIIHIHFASRASFFRKSLFVLMSRVFRKKIVLHAHGGKFHLFYEVESGIFQKWYIRWIFNQADRLLVLSRQWQDFYRRAYTQNEPIVIPNPVYCPSSCPNHSKFPPVVLTLGRLGQGKGTYDLLQAIPKILKHHPQVEFWLGGDGEVAEVEQILTTKSWGEHVKLLGWVTGSQKEEVLARASLFVLPSYNEGLPVAILEAMSYGLPVVSTSVGGIPEAVVDGETGFLIEPGDVKALAQRVVFLLDDAELRMKMGTNARQRALEKFEVGAILRQLFAVYDELRVSGTLHGGCTKR